MATLLLFWVLNKLRPQGVLVSIIFSWPQSMVVDEWFWIVVVVIAVAALWLNENFGFFFIEEKKFSFWFLWHKGQGSKYLMFSVEVEQSF